MQERTPDTYPVAWPAFRFAAETGAMELAVAEGLEDADLRPRKVTAVLAACLASVDGQDVTRPFLRHSSIGTREWLLQQVAAQCRPALDWHEVTCPSCGTPFDVTLDLAALPRAQPATGFPVVDVAWEGEILRFEVPNGTHEEAVAAHPSALPRAFLEACALDTTTREALGRMGDSALAEIEAALDHATPETADTVTADCPACTAPVTARIEPLAYAFPPARSVLRDVHLLSLAYSWSEESVLHMPTRRRKSYVGMVLAARGAA